MFGKTSSKSKDYLLISLITGLIVNIAMLAIAYFCVLKPDSEVKEIATTVNNGTVVSCVETSNIGSGVHKYVINVSTPYVYDDKEYEIRKCYSVSEDTWNKYAVGDVFDASKERYRSCSTDVSSPWDIDRIF